jgi:hypothetical protein
MANPWLEHVRAYRKKHPGKSYADCLVAAAKTYKKVGKGGKGGKGAKVEKEVEKGKGGKKKKR